MELGLLINLVFLGFYTMLLIAISIDEAREERRALKDFAEKMIKEAA